MTIPHLGGYREEEKGRGEGRGVISMDVCFFSVAPESREPLAPHLTRHRAAGIFQEVENRLQGKLGPKFARRGGSPWR